MPVVWVIVLLGWHDEEIHHHDGQKDLRFFFFFKGVSVSPTLLN